MPFVENTEEELNDGIAPRASARIKLYYENWCSLREKVDLGDINPTIEVSNLRELRSYEVFISALPSASTKDIARKILVLANLRAINDSPIARSLYKDAPFELSDE